MEKYRETIKKRITFGIGFLLVVIALAVYLIFFAPKPITDNHMVSFQMGMLSGIAAVALIYVFKYRRSLNDEKKLQLLYNEEHDERKRFRLKLAYRS